MMTVLALTVGTGLAILPSPVRADQPFLETDGTIVPAEQRYTFEGQAGQVVAITLNSTAFDPVLSLQNSAQEEVAFNDDYGAGLNSKLVFELPADDTYTVIARSYSGEGGDFQLVVRLATDSEIALAAAEALLMAEDYSSAIAAYSAILEQDPEQAAAYLGRAQATLGQIYLEQGESLEGPEDIPLAIREAVIADFEKAADILEMDEASASWAASLREQANFLRNPGAE
jgi:tetratricopeptide (TPR) repeat protein